MKELFGIDVTTSKRNDVTDGLSYETKKIGSGLEERMDRYNESAEGINKSASLPAALNWIRWAGVLGLVIIASGLVRNLGKLTFREMYRNAPYIFIIGGALALISAVITIYGVIRKRRTEDTDEARNIEADMHVLVSDAFHELGIPENAEKIDGLLYCYKVKDGEIKLIEKMPGHFIRSDVYVFCQNGCLSICDSAVRYDVPIRDIEGIDIIKKRFYMNEWAKDADISDDAYRDFVYERTDNLGRIWLRSVCAMRFKLHGEEFIFRFPTYELKTIESLTGIRGAEAN